jgi:hypothetical protein
VDGVPRLSREARGAKTGATENGREKEERECYSGLGSESWTAEIIVLTVR